MFQGVLRAMLDIVFTVFAITFSFTLLYRYVKNLTVIQNQLLLGLVFGVFGVINMAMNVELAPGIIIDLRSPIVLVAGVYGGGIGAFMTAGIMSAYRLWGVGGIGAIGGVVSLLGVAGLATYWHHIRSRMAFRDWLYAGLLSVAVSVLAGVLLLPAGVRTVFLRTFLPTALIFYPLLTAVLGQVIRYEYDYIQLRKTIQESRQRFRAIFNQTFQFVGLLKPDGTLIEANETALHFAGLTASDVIGKPFWETSWWSLSEATQTRLKKSIAAAAAGEFVRYQVDVVGKEGAIMTIDFSLKPILNESGEVMLLIPEGRDITAELQAHRHEIQLEIERAKNDMLRQFIEDSSHHLRTPVTILSSGQQISDTYLTRLQDQLNNLKAFSLPDGAWPVLTQIDHIITRLEKRSDTAERTLKMLITLIEELLELTRLDKDDTLRMKTLNLVPLLKHLPQTYETLLAQRQISLRIDPPLPAFVAVYGDETRLQLLWDNLITNAIRYSHDGSVINLCCCPGDGFATIAVQDAGIGIAEADQAKIFERFYRADNARVQFSDGSGLGLSIVKRIVERHQGTIQVESALDDGTTVTVRLPLTVTATGAHVTEQPASNDTASLHS